MIKRRKDKTLIFKDYPNFRPNLTPREVILKGSFGGGYFRPIYSSMTKKHYVDYHKKFEKLFEGIGDKLLTNEVYDKSINKYEVKCGSSLEDWESRGWIKSQNPYGWFEWYCWFYLGKRTEDDERQIKRWEGISSDKGRFKKRLVNMIKNKGTTYDDYNISPVIRQTLLHWAYELIKNDL
jgi:hypothetical protein